MPSRNEPEEKTTILVAEDSATQAAQLAALLEEGGYAVEVARNGRAALEAARAHRPALMISDVVMPELDGYGLSKALKSDPVLKDIPLLLVTTLSNPADVLRGLECGADNFMRKPYEGRSLLSRVRYLLTNSELRKGVNMQMGVEITLGGKRQFITAERQQILDLLVSTYEEAVELNSELEGRARELARSNRMVQGLYAIAEGLNAVVGETQVAETALERALELPGVCGGWIAVSDGPSDFRIIAKRGVPPALNGPEGLQGLCECRRKLLAGDLDHTTNMVGCERLKSASGDTFGFTAHACVPIWIEGKPAGIMNLLGDQQGLFTEEDARNLYTIGNQLGVAFSRARLHDGLERAVAARTAELAASEALLRKVLETLPVGVRVADAQGRVTMVNPAAGVIWGGPSGDATQLTASLELVGWRADSDDRVAPEAWPLQRAVRTGETVLNELFDIETASGARKTILNSAVPIIDASGAVTGSVSVTEDVTERRTQEKRIARLTRMHAMLSGINSTIVRVKSREELFSGACHLVVDTGGFLFVHIRLVNAEQTALLPTAYVGLEDVGAKELDLSDADSPSIAVRAYRSSSICAWNDLEAVADRPPLLEAAMQHGCAAAAALPLRVGDEVLGTVTIGSREKSAFDDEEIRLLQELAGDIAFALDHLAKEARINYLVLYDSLTELANRALFQDRIEQLVHGARGFAVAAVNVAGFRRINETFGMHGGDALLKAVAQRLAECAGKENVGRIGADKFGAICEGIGDAAAVARWVEWLGGELTKAYWVDGNELRLDLRIGVATFPADAANAAELLTNAESARERAGKAGVRFVAYHPELNARVAERLMLENRLRRAVEDEQFMLCYQPKLDLQTGAIVGAEALIRWQDPERGLISPGSFIPVLEETGLILEVGRWALRRAAADVARWRQAGLRCPEIAVNVSQIQMRETDFAESVIAALGSGSEKGAVSLEITESLIMENVEDSIAKLMKLREAHISVAVDDFGTGYSSLSYLSKLPIDALKIDQSFVSEMTRDPNAMTLVSTIITLANAYHLKVIAEGVETEEQVNLLRLARCEQAQGFLFHKPLPEAQFVELLGGNGVAQH